jgi:hypothetical protein
MTKPAFDKIAAGINEALAHVRGDDSDETEGRRLYRAQADALARSQVSMAKRKVKLRKRYGGKKYPL